MSIYRIHSDIQNYMLFTVDDLDVYTKMESFNIQAFGQSLPFEWQAPKANFLPSDSGSTEKPDMTQWTDTILVLNKKAVDHLKNILETTGELFPLVGSCKDYMLFNSTQRQGNDIINLEQSTSSYFEDGAWERVEKLVFTKAAPNIVPPLFTIEYDRGCVLYCTDAFRHDVQRLGLSGLAFQLEICE
ncbi:hypothetical protein [Agarilytica rhodophyticola]|uniref:hypothetical protein n=1 Tax=Agarilytica rhodophyticola TaxID=1737490 RepID=UPI000B348E5C|nr:hypothetical protein [Agarilytica rhodophyticola]